MKRVIMRYRTPACPDTECINKFPERQQDVRTILVSLMVMVTSCICECSLRINNEKSNVNASLCTRFWSLDPALSFLRAFVVLSCSWLEFTLLKEWGSKQKALGLSSRCRFRSLCVRFWMECISRAEWGKRGGERKMREREKGGDKQRR